MGSPYEINLRTTADASGAKQTEEALLKLNQQVEKSAAAAKQAEKATDELSKSQDTLGKETAKVAPVNEHAKKSTEDLTKAKRNLKEAVQALAIEFPLLGRVMSATTSAMGAAVAAVAVVFGTFINEWKKLKEFAKDDSPLRHITTELGSAEKITAALAAQTERYAAALSKANGQAKNFADAFANAKTSKEVQATLESAVRERDAIEKIINAQKAKLEPLDKPDVLNARVTAAEQLLQKANAEVEQTMNPFMDIARRYGTQDISELRKKIESDTSLGTFRHRGMMNDLDQYESAEQTYSIANKLVFSERNRQVRVGSERGQLEVGLQQAQARAGQLDTFITSAGSELRGVATSMDKANAALTGGLSALEQRQAALEQWMRDFQRRQETRASNQRLP